ncbi:hypothetical protein J2X73_000778 [Novosphingobium sp. 1748]|nr:hypothetical protein [Novosphingobium sp. 1748]
MSVPIPCQYGSQRAALQTGNKRAASAPDPQPA